MSNPPFYGVIVANAASVVRNIYHVKASTPTRIVVTVSWSGSSKAISSPSLKKSRSLVDAASTLAKAILSSPRG